MEGGDDVLVARLRAGDDDALAEVFDRYGGLLLGIATRVTASRSVGEDVVQDVLTALWRRPEQFDAERGSLRAYLGMQAHRRAVDTVRSDSRRRAREERCDLFEALSITAAGDGTDSVALSEVVRQAIDRLPGEQRRAVELAFWHGRTHREVAAELGIPEGTVKSRLRLAQSKLAQWLAPMMAEAR